MRETGPSYDGPVSVFFRPPFVIQNFILLIVWYPLDKKTVDENAAELARRHAVQPQQTDHRAAPAG